MSNNGNLKPFPKGVSGNPGGRPRRKPLTDALSELLDEPYPKDPAGRTYVQVIAGSLAAKAARGDVRAAQEIGDRTEGRVAMAESPAELPPAGRLSLTLEQWDALLRGEGLLGDGTSEFEKSK